MTPTSMAAHANMVPLSNGVGHNGLDANMAANGATLGAFFKLCQVDMQNYVSSLVHNRSSTQGHDATHVGNVHTKGRQINKMVDIRHIWLPILLPLLLLLLQPLLVMV